MKKEIPVLEKERKKLVAIKAEYDEQGLEHDDEMYEKVEAKIAMLNKRIKEARNEATAKGNHNKLVNRAKLNYDRALDGIAKAEYERKYPGKDAPKTMKQSDFSPDVTPLALHLLHCIETPKHNGFYCYRPDITIVWETESFRSR